LALIFTAIFRNDKKKLKNILTAIPSIVLCYLLFVCSFTFIYIFIICSALAILFGASIAVGYRFSNKKVILCLVAILLLPSSLALLTTFEYYELREPFGYIKDKTLPDSLSNRNFDYEVKLNHADAWGNNHYTVTMRGKHVVGSNEDSIVYCKQYRMCAGVTFILEDSVSRDSQSVQATPRNICQWEPLPQEKKETLLQLKKLAEKYRKEYTFSFVLDGYTFGINILDFKKKTIRSLELGNASEEVPNAQEIVNLGLTLIPFSDSADVEEKCNDRLPQIFVEMKIDLTQDSTKKEMRNPKQRRRATKR
jgi:energy-coupling factor transporter transmembrane protein EcfT